MIPPPSRSILGPDGQKLEVLVSGASFAGLTTAWWMSRLGYSVTVVEIAKGLRKGGTPVNIEGSVIEVVKRMGLLERIASHRLKARSMEFLDAHGTAVARIAAQATDAQASTAGHEIERDILLDMLFDAVNDQVEFLFDDSISALEESAEEIAVTFASGKRRCFSFLFGCDGTRSAVRRMCFGEDSSYSIFLQNYFSLTIVDKLLIEENTTQMFNVPGKAAMLSAYNKKTDIAFCFFAEKEVAYDRRNRDEQKQMVLQHFETEGWRIRELLEEMTRCDDFYFDKLCQIRMRSWTSGRVALVGDAGYCPSPAAGMGGSMAMLGAAALGDAFKKYPGDFRRAFQEYDDCLRPTVEEIQRQAVEVGLEMFAPKTEAAIRERNARLNGG
jgi:2-polyprenyl-6-methoxyphenol hydroxylase-like FAD-dependent oxidoreductase